ncbi:MAG: carboxypeptidase-like regulatory domain-containing protein [Verrucomicrobiota bacterium]|nr:carboxypeptidase-like regulatory domain-containing protein [Verrucomicrobiota bacterium]
MLRNTVTTLSSLVVMGFSCLGAAQVEWTRHKTEDGSHPDGNEQQMLWLMNRARVNPAAEGEWLANGADGESTNAMTAFKVNKEVLKAEFNSYPATGPAAFEARIYEASRAHSEYLISTDSQSHDGQLEKLEASGFTFESARVSVFSFAKNPIYAHAAFNIDWGNNADGMQTGRGHRLAIMSLTTNNGSIVAGDYANVGIVILPDNNSLTNVGPMVVSIAYCKAAYWITDGSQFNRYLVGTVWRDINENNRYDPGEGLNGVKVQPNNGAYYATTGVAGGYAIPMPVAGDYEVTYSGGALPSARTVSVSVGAVSALLDHKYVGDPVSDVMGPLTVYDGGYCVSPWLGGFYNNYWPFLYNDTLGFMYTVGNGEAVFFFDFSMNGGTWLYSGPGVYPFFFDFNQSNWLYAQGRFAGLRYFARFTPEHPNGVSEGYP